MAVNNPRNRILIFRLTQGEYDALRTASSEKGARSLSDYARGKLLGSPDGATLDAQINELKTTVTRIAQLLEKE
jgi:hypothetical protein